MSMTTCTQRSCRVRSFLKTGNLFGLQYIYGTLTNSTGKDPLDFPTLKNNPAEYEVVVTNALTGKAEYFGKETMVQDDYRLIMASSAIPAACRPVELNDIPYFDGGLSDAIPVSRALEKGCDRLVVILSKMRDYVRKPQGMRFLYTMRCRQYPHIISLIDHRHIAYNQNLQEVFALEREGKAFVFAPSHPIHVGTYSMNEQSERDLYALGMEDFNQQQDALAAFMTD